MDHRLNTVKSKEGLRNDTKDYKKNNPIFGIRHIQSICLFLTLSVSMTVRAQLSVTIVAMTETENDKTEYPALISNASYVTSNFSHINNVKDFVNLQLDDYADFNGTNHNLIDFEVIKNDINKTSQAYVQNCSNSDINKEFQNGKVKISKKTLHSKPVTLNSGWSVHRTYNWSKPTQDIITGSFFVGYTVMQLPMGVLSQRFGGKLPLMVALFANGVLSFVTPWAAIIGWQMVSMCRLLQGMTQAALYPSLQTMLGKWAPVSERGRLTTYIFTGSSFGTILAFQLAGFLAGSPSFGWPFSFWVSGILSLACGMLLTTLGAASPAEHPTITSAEKYYIMGHDDEDIYQATRKTPWKEILSSVPVWAMVCVHAGSTYSYIFLLVQMPVYMSKILCVDIKYNGLFSSLPYVAMYLMGLVSGQLSDFFINRGYVSIINARRIANTIGTVVSSVFMVGAAFASSVSLAVTLLVLSMALHSGVQVGFLINQIDLAPNFAGTLMSLANVVGNFMSLGAPVLVSLVVTEVENQFHWQLMFMITAGITIISNVFFVVSIKVDVQSWNDADKTEHVVREGYEQVSTVADGFGLSDPANEEVTKL